MDNNGHLEKARPPTCRARRAIQQQQAPHLTTSIVFARLCPPFTGIHSINLFVIVVPGGCESFAPRTTAASPRRTAVVRGGTGLGFFRPEYAGRGLSSSVVVDVDSTTVVEVCVFLELNERRSVDTASSCSS